MSSGRQVELVENLLRERGQPFERQKELGEADNDPPPVFDFCVSCEGGRGLIISDDSKNSRPCSEAENRFAEAKKIHLMRLASDLRGEQIPPLLDFFLRRVQSGDPPYLLLFANDPAFYARERK